MNESPLRTIVFALAIVTAGLFVAGGIQRFRLDDRYVTVKGVAERDVEADVGIWPLRFTAASNDLAGARHKVESDRLTVLRFLARYGVDSSAVQLQRYEVTDDAANPYRNNAAANRFIVSMTLVARSGDPAKIAAASQAVGELVAANVVLQSGDYSGGPTYLFTKLNTLKPAMLAEATRNARDAAGEFARESKSGVGAIRRATQGVFEILPRDPAPGISEGSQIQKTLRVVATMDYYLK